MKRALIFILILSAIGFVVWAWTFTAAKLEFAPLTAESLPLARFPEIRLIPSHDSRGAAGVPIFPVTGH